MPRGRRARLPLPLLSRQRPLRHPLAVRRSPAAVLLQEAADTTSAAARALLATRRMRRWLRTALQSPRSAVCVRHCPLGLSANPNSFFEQSCVLRSLRDGHILYVVTEGEGRGRGRGRGRGGDRGRGRGRQFDRHSATGKTYVFFWASVSSVS